MVTHDQFSASLETLAGFRWIYDGFDQLDSDLPKGHRLLLGGVDGEAIRTPQRTPGFTWALVVKRAAEAAASIVVKRELIDEGERIMLLEVTTADRPGDAAFTRELQSLHRRLYACPLTKPGWRHGDAGQMSASFPRQSLGRPSSRCLRDVLLTYVQ